ncbi:hypothetical protein ACRRTK_018603 [Alexandromys fortis]
MENGAAVSNRGHWCGLEKGEGGTEGSPFSLSSQTLYDSPLLCDAYLGLSPRELFTIPTNKGICSSRHAMSEFIQQQTDTGSSFQLEPEHLVNQEFLDLHSSESYLWANNTTSLKLPGNLSFSNLDSMVLLERQDQKMPDSFKTWEKIQESDQQNFPVSHALGSCKGSLSGKPSGTSRVSQCQEKFETALQKPLVSHLNETNKGQRAGTASRAGHCPLPFTSCVENEEHEAQRQSRSDNKDRHAKSTHTMTKPVLHQASMVLHNTSMKESEGSKHSPDVPRISTEATPAPLGKHLECFSGAAGSLVHNRA